MTIEELKQYRSLVNRESIYALEIEMLKDLLNEKIEPYSSSSISGMPSGGISSPTEQIAIANLEYAEKINERIRQYEAMQKECLDRIKAIEDFINGIEDEETQTMLLYFATRKKNYSQIARRMYVSRNYVAKRIKGVCR